MQADKDLFFHKVEEILKTAVTGEYCMISVDVENFKLYNRWYGVEEGDLFLNYIGYCLKEAAGHRGIAAHVEGDDFAALLPNQETLIVELTDKLKYYIDSRDKSIGFYPVVGVRVIEDTTLSAGEIYDKAALARTFLRGNYMTRICWYDESMVQDMEVDHHQLNEMKRGLERGEFIFYLQPKCNMITGEVIGMESLARWEHPEQGLLLPGKFISRMEHNGLVTNLDLHIWDRVCAMLRRWLDEGRRIVPVSINVSRVDFMVMDVTEELKQLADAYRLPRELLEVEITESACAENELLVRKTCEQLREAGFTVAMDDFGRGYSSLTMLKNVAVDVLKIDMRFLEMDLDSQEKSKQILTAVIQMAKALKMQVIVEGVEKEMQRKLLIGLGCLYAQGFYFYRPMPVKQAEKLLAGQGEKSAASYPVLKNESESPDTDQMLYERLVNHIFDEVLRLDYKDRDYEELINGCFALLEHRWDFDSNSRKKLRDALYPDRIREYCRSGEVARLDVCTTEERRVGVYILPKGECTATVLMKDCGRPCAGELLKRLPMLEIVDYDVERDVLRFESENGRDKPWQCSLEEFCSRMEENHTMTHEGIRHFRLMVKKAVSGACHGILEYRSDYRQDEMHWHRLRYISLANSRGKVYRIVGVASDIDEERKSVDSWRELAIRDRMTGLLNHDTIYQYIEESLSGCEGGTLILIDIDDFKKVNDSIGHMQGDEFIKKAAAALRGVFRKNDIIGRFGGDEFVVFMPGMVSVNLVKERVQALQEAIETIRVPIVGVMKCSVGIACATGRHFLIKDLFKQADYALYEAKNEGKGHYAIIENGRVVHQELEPLKEDKLPAPENDQKITQMLGEMFLILYKEKEKHAAVNAALAYLGQTMDVCRVYVFRFEEGGYARNLYEWCAKGIAPEISHLQHVDLKGLGWEKEEHFDEDGIWFCPDVSLLPDALREMLQQQGICSMLHWAFRRDGEIIGMVGFDECRENIVWNSRYVNALKLAGAVISEYLLGHKG